MQDKLDTSNNELLQLTEDCKSKGKPTTAIRIFTPRSVEVNTRNDTLKECHVICKPGIKVGFK